VGERYGAGPVRLDHRPEAGDIERLPCDLVIHPGAELGEIGEPDAELKQRGELVGLVQPRRDPGLIQRAPEAIAVMNVIVPAVR
jgi:hypothetical protein